MNPMMMALQMARGGQNPMAMLENLAGQNPQMAQAMRLIQGKSPEQLRSVASNMAKERGIDLDQMAQGMGLRIPK